MYQARSYVRKDGKGVLRVGATRVPLDSVVAGFHQWHSAETIQQLNPDLNLEEVYGALAFYLANQAEVHDYLRRRQESWEHWRERAEQLPNLQFERRGLRRACAAARR